MSRELLVSKLNRMVSAIYDGALARLRIKRQASAV